MKPVITRRRLFHVGAAFAAVSCIQADGGSCSLGTLNPQPNPEPGTTPTTGGPAPAGQSPFPGPVRPDGNVRRVYGRVGGHPATVEWQSPAGDIRLTLEGARLVLVTSRDGTRTLRGSDLTLGSARDLVEKRLGASVLDEARAVLALAA